MRCGAAVLAGVALIVAVAGTFKAGGGEGGGGASGLLSWTIPLASENPAAAAALGNVAAISAKSSFDARSRRTPQEMQTEIREQRRVGGLNGEEEKGGERWERRERKGERREWEGEEKRTTRGLGRLKVRDCATWSSYCQEELAKEWMSSLGDQEMEEERTRGSNERAASRRLDDERSGEHRDRGDEEEERERERGGRRREEERREEGMRGGGVRRERERREGGGGRAGLQWGRQERTISWPKGRREEGPARGDRRREEQEGRSRQQQEEEVGHRHQPLLSSSGSLGAQQEPEGDAKEKHKKKMLGIAHFTMPHLPAETAVWVANQVASRASGFVTNPARAVVTDVDTRAKEAFKQGTKVVVMRRQDEGFFPKPLGQDWASKQRVMKRRNAELDANSKLTKDGMEMMDIERERQRIAAEMARQGALARMEAKHHQGSSQGLLSKVEALKGAIAQLERERDKRQG